MRIFGKFYMFSSVGTTGYAYVSNMATAPKRYLAYLATFSRMATVCQVYDFLCDRLHFRPEDIRLWFYRDEVTYNYNLTQFCFSKQVE